MAWFYPESVQVDLDHEASNHVLTVDVIIECLNLLAVSVSICRESYVQKDLYRQYSPNFLVHQ